MSDSVSLKAWRVNTCDPIFQKPTSAISRPWYEILWDSRAAPAGAILVDQNGDGRPSSGDDVLIDSSAFGPRRPLRVEGAQFEGGEIRGEPIVGGVGRSYLEKLWSLDGAGYTYRASEPKGFSVRLRCADRSVEEYLQREWFEPAIEMGQVIKSEPFSVAAFVAIFEGGVYVAGLHPVLGKMIRGAGWFLGGVTAALAGADKMGFLSHEGIADLELALMGSMAYGLTRVKSGLGASKELFSPPAQSGGGFEAIPSPANNSFHLRTFSIPLRKTGTDDNFFLPIEPLASEGGGGWNLARSPLVRGISEMPASVSRPGVSAAPRRGPKKLRQPPPSEGAPNLPYFLKAARVQKGMTQGELAQAVGLSKSAVSHMEQGVSKPSPATRWKLERELGLKEGELGGVYGSRRKGPVMPKAVTDRPEGPLAFGEAVRQARLKTGMTQIELAQLVGMSRRHIGLIERGGVNSTAATRQKLEKALGLPEGYLESVRHAPAR